jgi:hypothetical protein
MDSLRNLLADTFSGHLAFLTNIQNFQLYMAYSSLNPQGLISITQSLENYSQLK